jgi:hypothetical protein
MQDAGCRMQDAGCRMQDAGCRMQDAGCRIQDAGCNVTPFGGPMIKLKRKTWEVLEWIQFIKQLPCLHPISRPEGEECPSTFVGILQLDQ